MNTFREKIEELRTELIRSIIELLADNGLEELRLSYKQSDHIYTIWFNDNGDPFECTVRKVVRQGDGITVVATSGEVEGELEMDSRYELGARNLDWLCDIRDNMLTTIKEISGNEDDQITTRI